jgi:hypothetical protein
MHRRSEVIDRELLNPFFSYLLFCGIALLLSTPAAVRVRDFEALSLLSGIPIFFYVHVLFSGILGLNLGAVGAARGETGTARLFRLIERILLAEALTLPFVVFEAALYPGRETTILLAFLYAALLGLLCGLVATLLEKPHERGTHPFFLKYMALAVLLGAPWAIEPVASPLGMVDALFHGTPMPRLLLGFGVILALLFFASAPYAIRVRRRHA